MFSAFIIFFSLLPALLIPIVRISRGFLGVEYGLFISFSAMALFTFVLIFPMGLSIGFTFPLGCKIMGGKTSVSRIYVFEALGSLSGGILFSFVLIRFFSTQFIAALLLLVFNLFILIYSLKTRNKKKLIKFSSSGLIIVAVVLIIFPGKIDHYSEQKRWENLVKNMPLLSSIDSKYQNLAFTDGRLYVNNTQEKFDLAILNLPDPSSAVMNRYYTKEFFQQLRQNCKDKALVAIPVTSSENYMGPEITGLGALLIGTFMIPLLGFMSTLCLVGVL